MAKSPIPQQIYRHFKGNLYQIISLAEHTETGQMLVIYQALYGEFKIYARPLSMFMEKVDKEKYPHATQEYRFELQDNSSSPVPVSVYEEEDKRQKNPEPENQTGKNLAETLDPTEHLNSVAESRQMQEQKENQETETEAELTLDPLVLEFLDAGSYEERLNILAALHHRITDDMINVMAVAIDVEVKEGDIEQRYAELRRCLLLFDKFECSRLR